MTALAVRTSRLAAALLLATGGLAACSFGPPPPDQAGQPPRLPTPTGTPSVDGDGDDGGQQTVVDVLATGLAVPWGLAFLPDGSALVTERDKGRIIKISQTVEGSASPGATPPAATPPNDAPSAPQGGSGQPEAVPSAAAPGLAVTPVQTLTDAVSGGEGGVLGIAVSPQYTSDQTVYVYYSTAHDNRIVSLKLGGEPTPVLTGIPHGRTDNGGSIGFGPDGMLYATTGDAGTPAAAADPKSLAGKVLRMKPDGKPATGNPTANSVVYASGLHDPQGLAWDQSKHLYVTDRGNASWDEIDLVQPGKNYGWPAAEGPAGDAKYTDPVVQLKPSDAGCAGAAISGDVLVTGCLTGARLYAVQLTAAGGTLGAPTSMLQNQFGRLRTVVRAPDGSIWVTTSNRDGQGKPAPEDDRVLRIVLADSGVGLS